MSERSKFDYTHGLDTCSTLIQSPYRRGTSDGKDRLVITHERKSHIMELDFTKLRTSTSIRTLHQIDNDTHGDTHMASAIRTTIRKIVYRGTTLHLFIGILYWYKQEVSDTIIAT